MLDLLLDNLSNKEIAGKLVVCERTVKFHVSNLQCSVPPSTKPGSLDGCPFAFSRFAYRLIGGCMRPLLRPFYSCGLGVAASGLTTVLGGIGGFWTMSLVPAGFALGATVFALGSTGFMSGAVFAFGSTVFTLGVTVFAFGATGFALGATGLALGVTGLALGTGLALAATGLALGIGLAAGAVGLALAAGLALGAAPRWAKHTPVSKPSIMPPTISFLMPFCLRSEGRMSFLKVRVSSESLFDFR